MLAPQVLDGLVRRSNIKNSNVGTDTGQRFCKGKSEATATASNNSDFTRELKL